MGLKDGHPLVAHFSHVNAEGEVIWESGPVLNTLADEGESDILDIAYRNATNPTTLYGRLYNDTPVETDTLATLTGEVSGTGYAAVSWTCNGTDFPTLALDTGDYKVTSATKTFSASGAWTAATYLVVATVASGTAGKLWNYFALSATRTLASGESLNVSFNVKLS